MKKNMLLIIIATTFFLSAAPLSFRAVAYGQPWSGLIDPSRAIDWSGAGIPGGIRHPDVGGCRVVREVNPPCPIGRPPLEIHDLVIEQVRRPLGIHYSGRSLFMKRDEGSRPLDEKRHR